MTERLVTDPVSGEEVPPANGELAAVCLDARDICLLAADLAVVGDGFGAGDEAAQALGLGQDGAAYHTAFHTTISVLRQIKGVTATMKVADLSPEIIMTAYLEAAAALQEYAATANAN